MFSTHKNINITDFSTICRTCLQTIDLRPINDYVLFEILHKIADITFSQNDGYPQQLCVDCIKKIYDVKAFAMQAKESDFILKKCVTDSKTYLHESLSLRQNIPLEPIVIKEEPDEMEEQGKSDHVQLPEKHFLAMEPEEGGEESNSSNDDYNQQYIARVNYHRNLIKTPKFNHNVTVSPVAPPGSSTLVVPSETSDENSSYSETSKESILKQMLKEKQPEEKSDLTYECGLCLKQFSQLNQFINHQSEHNDLGKLPTTVVKAEEEKKFKCLICAKTFKDSTYLIRHGRVHGNRPYKCDQCDKSYIESGHLVVHKRTHTGERPFMCESCPKAFVSLSNLVKHRVVHTGLRKIFTCDICGKEMNDPSNLRKHRRVHTKEKPFKCKYCETAFSGASDLRAHERLHTGERPYACDMCNRKFSRSTYLTKHRKTCVELLRVKSEMETTTTTTSSVGLGVGVVAPSMFKTSGFDLATVVPSLFKNNAYDVASSLLMNVPQSLLVNSVEATVAPPPPTEPPPVPPVPPVKCEAETDIE